MTDELRAAINRELPEGGVPFCSLDVDAVVAAGRAARRRRHVGAGGAVLSVTAGAAALAVMLPLGTIGTPPSGGSPPSSDTPIPTTSPGPQPPRLDAAAGYYWMTELETEQTEGTGRYTDAFWDFFTVRYPGAELIDMDGSGSWREQLGPPEQFARFERALSVLNEGGFDDNGAPVGEHEYVFERTTYSLTQLVNAGQPSEGHSDTLTVRFEGRGDARDAIDVEVLPAGTYRRELGPLHPTMCYPDSDRAWAACEAEDTTGPTGEDLQYVTGMTQDDGSEPVASAYFVVLYRPDGSAVVVSDDAHRLATDDPAPYLSFEELAEIATALPALPAR
jgi:hypothetical protein